MSLDTVIWDEYILKKVININLILESSLLS